MFILIGHQDFPTKYAYPTKPRLSLFFGRKYVLLFFIGHGSFKPTRDINTLTSKYNVSLAKEKLTYLYQYSETSTTLVSDMVVGAYLAAHKIFNSTTSNKRNKG